MKFALSAVALALAAPAFAQSSVTVYGVVDLNGVYAKGQSTDVMVNSGGLQGSRLGFKGSEDLGGGMRADFVLEGGINVDSGSSAQGGSLFGRQAFGALRTPFGSFSAGRQYSSIYTVTTEFSAFANNNVGPSTALLGGFASGYEPVRGASSGSTPPASGTSTNGGPARVNNSFRYTSPSYAGFTASGMYGAGEVTGGTKKTRLLDGSLRYTNYGLDAMVSFVNDKAQGATTAASTDVNTITVAALYGFDAFRVEAGFMKVDDKRDDPSLPHGGLDGQGYWVGGDYTFGSNLIRAQWIQNKPQHIAAGKAKSNAYGLGYQYNFSKRTSLYTSLTRFQNDANAGSNGLGRWNQAVPTNLTIASDNDITEFALGVRHAF